MAAEFVNDSQDERDSHGPCVRVFSILICVSLKTASVYAFRPTLSDAERALGPGDYPVVPALILSYRDGW